jgi:hypothetical protein
VTAKQASPPKRILLVSGMPGSGKSTFVRGLEGRGWGVVIGDALVPGTPIQLAWDSALRHADDEALFAEVAQHPTGFAIEFGFPAGWLDGVEGMRARGYDAWYFDADRAASRLAWLQANPGVDERYWTKQADELLAVRERIATVYGDRLIKTLSDERGHIDLEQIAAKLQIEW